MINFFTSVYNFIGDFFTQGLGYVFVLSSIFAIIIALFFSLFRR